VIARIHKSTLTQQVAEMLKEQILEGQLASGDRLWAQDLAEDLGVSVVPVKEALLILQGEGLITNIPRRGSVVKRFTVTELKELYDLRRMVEIEALRQLVASGGLTDAFIDELERCNLEIERNRDNGAVALAHDRRFHETLVDACGHKMLIELYGRLNTQAHIIRYATWKFGPRAEINFREHVAIVDALKARDIDAAERAIAAHLTSILRDPDFVRSVETADNQTGPSETRPSGRRRPSRAGAAG